MQEHWYSDNESSDGIPVLVSDSEESVIIIAEIPSPSVQGPCIIARATQALHTFSISCSDTSSLLNKYLTSILKLVDHMSKKCVFSGVHRYKKCINCDIFCWFAESLPVIPETLPRCKEAVCCGTEKQ